MSANFDLYKLFYYAGKYQNMSHAASVLFVSQSTVSRGIQSLEAELGCALFERTPSGVRLTEEGEILYRRVEKACENIFLGEEEVARMRRAPAQTLRVGVTDLSFSEFVRPALRTFRRDCPTVRIELLAGGFSSTGAMYDALLSGRTDVACTAAAALESMPYPAVRVTPAAAYDDIIVAHRSFPELREGTHPLSALCAYPMGALVIAPSQASGLEALLRRHHLRAAPVFQADSVSVYLDLIRDCPCVALIPSLFRDRLGGALFEVRVREPLPRHHVNILTVKNAPRNPLRDSFIQRLEEAIRTRVLETRPPDASAYSP